MPTRQQLETALINADKAGDAGAAKSLANALKSGSYEDPKTTDGIGSFETFAAGAGKAVSDIGLGASQLATDAGKFITGSLAGANIIPGSIANSVHDSANRLEQEAADRKIRDKDLMSTGAGLAGNVVGNIASFYPMAAPATTYKGAGLLGAAMGASQPVANEDSRFINAALASGGGVAGQNVANTISRVLAPKTSQGVMKLINEGVDLTPGQAAGGVFNRIEDAATSVPIMGDMIQAAQRRGIESFNKAALNRVLSPLGKKATKAGYEGVEDAYQAVSSSYDDLLPKLKVIADDKFFSDVDGLSKMAAEGLDDLQAARFNKIVDNDVLGKFVGDGRMSGETMKRIESELGKLTREFSKKGDDRLTGAVKELQASLRRMVERSNPSHKGKLSDINKAYANLLRVEKAAGSQGAALHDGVFTPAQLSSAVKSLDSSKNKRAFSHGNALMQDLSNAGKQIITQKVPDSGTAGRMLTNIGLGGLAYGVDPAILATVGAGAGLYTRPIAGMLTKSVAQRPESVRDIGLMLRHFAPYAGLLGSAATTH